MSGDVKKADLVDWEKGRALCANNEAFFRELLGVFTETKHDLELERYLKEEDFENYRIKSMPQRPILPISVQRKLLRWQKNWSCPSRQTIILIMCGSIIESLSPYIDRWWMW